MTKSLPRFVSIGVAPALAGAALLSLVAVAAADVGPSAPPVPPGIVIDGRFEDWERLTPVYIDPAGDHRGADVDFGTLNISSDSERIYVYFELGSRRNLQNDNAIVLYVDTDNAAETGLAVGALGADLEWRFGERAGIFHGRTRDAPIGQADLGLRQGPTVSSTAFEISLDRGASLGGTPVFPTRTIAIVIRNEENGIRDWLPDDRGKLVFSLSSDEPPAPCPASLGRLSPAHVRVLSYNVLFDGIFKRPGPFVRILRALDPDVICFQEVMAHTAQQTADQVSLALPDATWHSATDGGGVTVSRYPIADSHVVEGERPSLWTLIDLPDDRYPSDLSVVNAHPPCCWKNEERQRALDSIAAWHRELQSPGARAADARAGAQAEAPGTTPRLPSGTPIVIAGDMNLVGYARQVETLLAGRIEYQEEFGPSHAADWDGTPLADAWPYHTTCREAYTWRGDDSPFSPGRLDYVVYSDSVIELAKGFVLWTPEMSEEDLAASGLRADDTAVASDHLPVVADFAFPAAP